MIRGETMQRLMIADGSDVVRKVGKRILTELGFLVAEADTSVEALSGCQAELPALLIVEAGLEGALELIRTCGPCRTAKACAYITASSKPI